MMSDTCLVYHNFTRLPTLIFVFGAYAGVYGKPAKGWYHAHILINLGGVFLMSFLFIMPAVLGPSTTPQPSASPVLSAAPTPSPAAAQEIRAVWVSFLEWQHTDFSSESAFRADATAIMQNIASLGANTVLPMCGLLGCPVPQPVFSVQPPLHRHPGTGPPFLTRLPCW